MSVSIRRQDSDPFETHYREVIREVKTNRLFFNRRCVTSSFFIRNTSKIKIHKIQNENDAHGKSKSRCAQSQIPTMTFDNVVCLKSYPRTANANMLIQNACVHNHYIPPTLNFIFFPADFPGNSTFREHYGPCPKRMSPFCSRSTPISEHRDNPPYTTSQRSLR